LKNGDNLNFFGKMEKQEKLGKMEMGKVGKA
jgi:hypothetical protein